MDSIFTINELNKYFRVHPRKRVSETPKHDAFGRELPQSIFEVYKKPSFAKQRAAFNCWALCERMGGFNFRIISHTCQFFTVSFDFPNPETGELMRAIMTGRNNDAYFVR